MEKSNLVFKDLYDFIQEAERNQYGMCYPFGNSNPESFAFHIYNNLRQVNIISTGDKNSVANFIFDGHILSVIPVTEGVAHYNNPLRISIATPIDSPMGSNEPLWEVDHWTSHLGAKGKIVKEVLRDVLWPFVNERSANYI